MPFRASCSRHQVASFRNSRCFVICQVRAQILMFWRCHLASFCRYLFCMCCMWMGSPATRSLCASELRTCALSNIEQRLASICGSSVAVLSSAQVSACQQYLATSKLHKICEHPSKLAQSLLVATVKQQSPCQRQQASFVLSNRSNSRANLSQANSVPTEQQQSSCQPSVSNSRANLPEASSVPMG